VPVRLGADVTWVTLAFISFTDPSHKTEGLPDMVPRLDPSQWSVARQLLVLQVTVIALVTVGASGAAFLAARETSEAAAAQRSLSVAETIAASPTVDSAVRTDDPTAILQPFAEDVRRQTGTDFVVIMSTEGIRWTHPTPSQIGGRFVGHIEQAVQGDAFTETYTGTLGPSVRAVVPVTSPDGIITALVSVGITTETVGETLRRQVPVIVGAGLAALLLASVGSWLVSRRLRRQTHDLGPAELGRMYDYYDAVLHAVREGLLLLDRRAGLQLANDEAIRLLGLSPGFDLGTPVDQLGLPTALGLALAEGKDRSDEIHLANDRVLVINQATARWKGSVLGTVVTLRDRTDLQELTGELDSVRGLAESLRSQAHEASNRMHTVISLIELGRTDEALEFATAELALAQELTDRVVEAVHEPVLAALLLGKAAQAHERGIELVISEDTEVPERIVPARELVTVVGNLVDNALDAVAGDTPPRRITFKGCVGGASEDNGGAVLVLQVSDTGPGLDVDQVERAFERGWSTKTDHSPVGRGLGLALVGQAVRRLGGTIEVAREGGAVFTVRIPVWTTDGAVLEDMP